MSTDVPIEGMTVAEKLALMERLWDDLSRCPENVPSPDWHGDVLAERIAAVREGRTSFVDWDEVKPRLPVTGARAGIQRSARGQLRHPPTA